MKTSPDCAPERDIAPEETARSGDSGGVARRIGIFDSGVGGLSVLRAIRRQLPHAELLYAADGAHAPYGDRDEAFVADRSLRIARFLRERGADMIVVACNTATAAAVAALRAQPDPPPIVGVEPGIKPAVRLSATGRIGVLATTRTLASEKFRRLAQAHAGDAMLVLQPCPGLADAIESAAFDEAELDALVNRHAAPLREAAVDVAVLGCTHYPFARERFERYLPGVALVDTADAVARQAGRFAAPADAAFAGGLAAGNGAFGPVRAWSSGDPRVLSAFAARWLGLQIEVGSMDA